MKEKTFEAELPAGYRPALTLDAKNKKTGILLNLGALALAAIVILIAAIPAIVSDTPFYVSLPIYLLVTISYTILHELVHGVVYKGLTGEKLTYGISWSCAFCGVPHIYTYRKTTILAVIAPFAFFSLIFLPLTIVLFFTAPLYYYTGMLIFATHLGGCVGDLYVLYLLLAKFKDKRLLVRDTGPAQTFYLPAAEAQAGAHTEA